MATRGFLIRFIDIGLIVLFGFLMISDIEAASRVELAGNGEDSGEAVEPREDVAFVVVEITADGAFIVGAGGAGFEDVAAPPDAETSPEERPAVEGRGSTGPDASLLTRVTSVEALQAVVADRAEANRSDGLETVVLIEPHPASKVQRTVDVMDLSDRLGLQKSLRMDIEVVPAGEGPGQVSPSDSSGSGSSGSAPGPSAPDDGGSEGIS
jgi:biopolymer transport protein ExbD